MKTAPRLPELLTKGGFSVTRLATTGGFLLSGNTTMLVGTDADRVDEAIHIIGENSCKRNKMVSGNTSFMPAVRQCPGAGHCGRRHHLCDRCRTV